MPQYATSLIFLISILSLTFGLIACCDRFHLAPTNLVPRDGSPWRKAVASSGSLHFLRFLTRSL